MKLEDSITITDLDLARLGNLKDAAHLAPELDRADIVPFRAVAPDVVTMNSRVAFEDETTGEFRIVTIVYPDEADAVRRKDFRYGPGGKRLAWVVGRAVDRVVLSGRPPAHPACRRSALST